MPTLTRKTWERRYSPLTDNERQTALAARPNPDAVNINELIQAVRAEQRQQGWCSEAWSYLGRIQVDTPRHGRVTVFAEHPQWNPIERDYDSWARNPRIPAEVTEVPTAEVLRVVKETLNAYPQSSFRAGIDNILGTLGVTYVEPTVVVKFRFEGEIPADLIRRNGYTVQAGADESNTDVRYMVGNLLRDKLRRSYDGLTFTTEQIG